MSVNDSRAQTVRFGGMHTCPISGCARRVPDHQLMCGRHWRLVSPNLQRRLYTAWDRGRGANTDLHAEVMRLCVEEVESKLAEAAR